jgi:poly(hydroxyalkanoate) depolymerase family esterase
MSLKQRWQALWARFRRRQPVIVTGLASPAAVPAANIDRQFLRRAYPGSHDRDYRIHIPPDYHRDEALPLLLVLHGCKQTHLDIQRISQFDALADQQRFLVVYPFVTNYHDIRVRNCWGWWRARHSWPGSGEVEDLWQLVDAVATEFGADRRRLFVAGLSSGGGMTSALLTCHPGRFAAGAVVAGVAFQESPRALIDLPLLRRRYRPLDQIVDLMAQARNNDRTPTPLLVVHSHGDETVRMGAAENLRDSWLRYFSPGKPLQPHSRRGRSFGVDWEHRRYGAGLLQNSLVETLFMEGPGHGWYGGGIGEFSFPYAPDISALIWEFCARHPRPQGAALGPAQGLTRFQQFLNQ